MALPVPHQALMIGMGVLSSLLFRFSLSGNIFGLFLSLLCQAPLYYIFLSQGAGRARRSLLMATVATALIMGVPFAIFYGALCGVPTLLMARCFDIRPTQKNAPFLAQGFMALFYYTALIMTLLFGLIEFALAHGLMDAMKPLLTSPAMTRLTGPINEERLMHLVRLSPGFSLYLSFLITFVVGSASQALYFKLTQGHTKKILNLETLELPYSVWFVFLGAGVCSYILDNSFMGVYALNVLLVLAVLFLVQGLSVLHAFCRNRPRKIGVLWTFYALVVMFQNVAFAMAFVGLVEPWIQMRRRIYEKTRR